MVKVTKQIEPGVTSTFWRTATDTEMRMLGLTPTNFKPKTFDQALSDQKKSDTMTDDEWVDQMHQYGIY